MILKIILSFLGTLALLFAASFLLDLYFIQQNWLRYTVVILLCITVLLVGGAVVWEYVKQLKNKN